jgi:hypothetical protein
MAAIEKKKANNSMQRTGFILLEQAVDDLSADIVSMDPEQIAGKEHSHASNDFILRSV